MNPQALTQEAPAREHQASPEWDHPSIEALHAEIDFWRARFEQERERLAKLWVLYQQALEDLLRERRPSPERRAETVVDEPAPIEVPRSPFRSGDYTLFTRMVKLKHGPERPIYFFSRRTPRLGRPIALPAGFGVEVSRTGLPFLHKIRAARLGDDGGRASGAQAIAEQRTKRYRPQCTALSGSGDQCRNSARVRSDYCASHRGYRPRTVAALIEQVSTKPRSNRAIDTDPALRGRGETAVHRVEVRILRRKGTEVHGKMTGVQCQAFTGAGRQCRNVARDESKYCRAHRGYQPKSVGALLEAHDTRPRVRGAADTVPHLRA